MLVILLPNLVPFSDRRKLLCYQGWWNSHKKWAGQFLTYQGTVIIKLWNSFICFINSVLPCIMFIILSFPPCWIISNIPLRTQCNQMWSAVFQQDKLVSSFVTKRYQITQNPNNSAITVCTWKFSSLQSLLFTNTSIKLWCSSTWSRVWVAVAPHGTHLKPEKP